MNRSTPKGWSTDAEYFKLCDDSSSGEDDMDQDSDTETESESSSGNSSSKDENPKMLKGYMKNTKKYKKILFEETVFPE